MHGKSDSEATSLDASTPPRSPRRILYYVQSPSNHDAEKMSYGSSPIGSPHHFHYHCSPIHHSRESSSSTSRFSSFINNPRNPPAWRKMHRAKLFGDEEFDEDDDDDDDDDDEGGGSKHGVARFYIVCFAFSFIVLFTVFSLILWGASKPYKPKITMKNVVIHSFSIQAGYGAGGVPTDMLNLNSTVKIHYRNPATFFGVHVSASPLDMYYYDLKVASGDMEKFYQLRKSERNVSVVVFGYQVPVYGAVSALSETGDPPRHMIVHFNLTFVMRSRAHVLGKLVKPVFLRKIRCPVTVDTKLMRKPQDLSDTCSYD